MHDYGLADVERILGIGNATLRTLIRERYVTPARGRRREYRFTFQDLIALRAARSLAAAGLPARKITRSLRELRRRLPEELPSRGLSIRAIGEQVVVREGMAEWDSASGQYVLAFDVTRRGNEVQVLEPGAVPRSPAAHAMSQQRSQTAAQPGEEVTPERSPVERAATAEELFAAALQLEEHDARAAMRLYRRCLSVQAQHGPARINLARLLQQSGDLTEAEQLYRHASCLSDSVALFNLAVLLEDAGRHAEAIESYTAALAVDPQLADAHYNLARLYELQGKAAHTIRHLRMYRSLAGTIDRTPR
jgi:tetratricopeptide (TPR) repeat protein